LSVNVTEYVDVEARACELGLGMPGALAILPRGFDSSGVEALAHESEAATIRKVLRRAARAAAVLRRLGM
jgi:hypothetical protein